MLTLLMYWESLNIYAVHVHVLPVDPSDDAQLVCQVQMYNDNIETTMNITDLSFMMLRYENHYSNYLPLYHFIKDEFKSMSLL